MFGAVQWTSFAAFAAAWLPADLAIQQRRQGSNPLLSVTTEAANALSDLAGNLGWMCQHICSPLAKHLLPSTFPRAIDFTLRIFVLAPPISIIGYYQTLSSMFICNCRVAGLRSDDSETFVTGRHSEPLCSQPHSQLKRNSTKSFRLNYVNINRTLDDT